MPRVLKTCIGHKRTMPNFATTLVSDPVGSGAREGNKDSHGRHQDCRSHRPSKQRRLQTTFNLAPAPLSFAHRKRNSCKDYRHCFKELKIATSKANGIKKVARTATISRSRLLCTIESFTGRARQDVRFGRPEHKERHPGTTLRCTAAPPVLVLLSATTM